MTRHTEAALQSNALPTLEAEAFALALSEGRSVSRENRIALEREAQDRYFKYRHTLLEGALTTGEVAQRLRTTRQGRGAFHEVGILLPRCSRDVNSFLGTLPTSRSGRSKIGL